MGYAEAQGKFDKVLVAANNARRQVNKLNRTEKSAGDSVYGAMRPQISAEATSLDCSVSSEIVRDMLQR